MHRIGRWRFVFYLQDHAPPHVHVLAAGEEYVVTIEARPRLIRVAGSGANRRAAARVIALVLEHQPLLIEHWESIHGPTQGH